MAIPYTHGVRMLFDAHQRFTRAGVASYLRLRNWSETPDDGSSSDFLEVGIPYAPSGTNALDSGYIDYPINPPPSVSNVSLHNIGLLAGHLHFGAKTFVVSHTFVRQQMLLRKLQDPFLVWRGTKEQQVIGIFYDDRLFSIESITHSDAGGAPVAWQLVCNALEQATVSD